MHNEMTELAHQRIILELQEAKEKIAHLSASNARLVGVDNKLARSLEERDDIQQECNSATQRAKVAEMRVASLVERCGMLL